MTSSSFRPGSTTNDRPSDVYTEAVAGDLDGREVSQPPGGLSSDSMTSTPRSSCHWGTMPRVVSSPPLTAVGAFAAGGWLVRRLAYERCRH